MDRFALSGFALCLCVSLSVHGETLAPYVGKSGPDGWRCHIIQPDPNDDGPDGINTHDWDGDGNPDVFANFEEGGFSRLYFNPGPEGIRERWTEYITFKHGPCEDSGIGDLDVLTTEENGGWGVIWFENPRIENTREGE